MKSRKRIVILTAILLVTVFATYYVAKTFFPRQSRAAAVVEKVCRGKVSRSVVATGKVEPRTRVEIKSKASGIVRFIYVKEGEPVKQGQILLELDRENLLARSREANAALDAAVASQNEANAELATAEATLDRTKSDAKVEEEEFAFVQRSRLRTEELFSEGLISRSELELADKQVSQASAKREAVLSSIKASEAQVGRARLAIERTKATVAQARAVAERTEEELQNATIRSPAEGVVLSRNVEVGHAVSSILQLGSTATLLMVLGDTSALFFRGLVNESDIAWVHLNQPVSLTVESFRDRRFVGKVTKISPIGVEKDKVIDFEVEVSILNRQITSNDPPQSGAPVALPESSSPAPMLSADPRSSTTAPLRPNMSVTAEITTQERTNVLVVPESAVIYDDHGVPFVEIHDPGTQTGRRKVPIQIGVNDGIRAEVKSGLQEGQEILLQ
jgi:HlyD family secretion protein